MRRVACHILRCSRTGACGSGRTVAASFSKKWRLKMDPYFEIYIPRLTRTLKLSKLRALTKLHNPKGTTRPKIGRDGKKVISMTPPSWNSPLKISSFTSGKNWCAAKIKEKSARPCGRSSACWKEMARAAGRTANTTTAEAPTRATRGNVPISARNTTSTCAVRRLVLMYERIVATPARQKSGGRCASCHSTTQKCHRVARVKGRHHDQR